MGNNICPNRQMTRQGQELQYLQVFNDGQGVDSSRKKQQIKDSLLSDGSNIGLIHKNILKNHQKNSAKNGQHDDCKRNLFDDKQFCEKDTNVQQFLQEQIIFQDGTRYIGFTKQQLPHGKGQEYNANGDHYKGQFLNGFKNGFGVYQFGSSERYEGQFVDNQMSGKGIYHYSNGDKYEGQFLRNKRHGKGIYELKQPNKQKLLMFQGSYIDDLRDGKGKLICLGSIIQGIWEKGVYIRENQLYTA